MNLNRIVGRESPFDTPATQATQGERFSTKMVTIPVRAECLAQQGVSKHEWDANCAGYKMNKS